MGETKVCGCGCGRPTPTAKRTRGDVKKGEPLRFIHGHSGGIGEAGWEQQDCGFDTPCWIWQGGKNQLGYGRLRVGGRHMPAHRLYYERAHGPVPDGLVMDHLCRVPSCVNPEHLEAVTPAENTRRGTAAKLTRGAARAIRESDDDPATLAARFGVSRDCVYDVLRGRCWV